MHFFPFTFPLLDPDHPDPGGKMNADLCGTGSIAMEINVGTGSVAEPEPSESHP